MLSNYLKILPHYIAPKRALTNFGGLMANVTTPWIKNYLIQRFVNQYDVNMHEAVEENPLQYACFNDFFVRHLKPEQRPIAAEGVVSPVDGVVSEIGDIQTGQIIQAKGRYYTVDDLLACDKAVARQFIEGRFATLYLSPKDYHRIHMPIDGRLLNMIYVPGKLFSVQPKTARAIPHLFARNERLVIFFETEIGLMAMVLVGATIVGAIGTKWHGDLQRGKQIKHFQYDKTLLLKKGEELGYFKLGSTVVLLFTDREKMQWNQTMHAGKPVQFGQAFGQTSTISATKKSQ